MRKADDAAITGGFLVDPQAVVDAEKSIRRIAEQLDDVHLNLDQLDDTTVGHPALAEALRAFGTQWNQRTQELRNHLNDQATALHQAGERYQDSDTAAARSLS
jgi:hypothetical protein